MIQNFHKEHCKTYFSIDTAKLLMQIEFYQEIMKFYYIIL